jgi:hypothetical protein
MMPTSPRSPLSFRTAGIPQYGWKDGVSDGAFPTRRSVQACSRHTLTTYWFASVLRASRRTRDVAAANPSPHTEFCRSLQREVAGSTEPRLSGTTRPSFRTGETPLGRAMWFQPTARSARRGTDPLRVEKFESGFPAYCTRDSASLHGLGAAALRAAQLGGSFIHSGGSTGHDTGTNQRMFGLGDNQLRSDRRPR